MKLLKIFLSRLFVFTLLIALQIFYIVFFARAFVDYNKYMRVLLTVISFIVVLWLVNKEENSSYKIAWIIVILVFPAFGGVLYLAVGNKRPSRRLKKKIMPAENDMQKYRVQKQAIKDIIINKRAISLEYLNHQSYPIYGNTETKYYSLCDYNYHDLLKDLKKAKHYIFMEYFIVSKGLMLDAILNILEEKVKEGVDVRFIYDDVGSITTLPYNFRKQLESMGIKCVVFNSFVPFVSLSINHRDHRKICVIDGYIGYSGGFNIADEYINAKVRFGHWKDTGIRLEGEAVWSLTTMFLSTWYAYRKEIEDIGKFRPEVYQEKQIETKGFVLPYGDSPLDNERIGENVYLNLITHASKSIKIMTPYFIIDDTMEKALILASQNGVQIDIYTPYIPDKKSVFKVTRSYYYTLLKAGIHIHEYKPGFLHAKVVLVDGKIATVGTINFDYRSLYLHFECNVLLYQCSVIGDIKKDFDEMDELCVSIALNESRRFKGLQEAILRLFAPLL